MQHTPPDDDRETKSYVPPKPVAPPRRFSFLGLLFKTGRSSLGVISDRMYAHSMGEFRLPGRKLFLASHPAVVNRVLVTESARFPKSELMRSMLSPLVGDGIFVSNGERWTKQRRMIDPAFEQARIQDVFPLMRDATEAMLARLDAHADGDILAVDEETTHVTADIIFRTIFSRELSRDEAARIFDAFARFQELIYRSGIWVLAGVPKFLLPGWMFAARHARTIRTLLERDVERRMDERAAGDGSAHKDILASLLDAVDPVTGERFSRRELVDQIAVMFLAGHETSASSLAWALYLIAMRPDVQARLHAEAAGVFAGRNPEFADMRRLKLARDVFRETLRLYPPVPLISRDALEQTQLRDKLVPEGSLVFLSPWVIHRHRKIWHRPDVFDPDRFADAATKESLRSGYIPFSTGPRVCLGASFAMQEATLILAYLALHYRFEPVAAHTPVPATRLSLRSKNGIRLRVFRRDQAQRDATPMQTSVAQARARCPFS
ncbi:MAG TPA: cytochrome P450 [Propylenella sp.]|nr:cytochrome P450 [Propylenella sp.]